MLLNRVKAAQNRLRCLLHSAATAVEVSDTTKPDT
jgi:hypothetical protein